MIDISKLKKEHFGCWVEYTAFNKVEIGRIKSWNDKFIFVVYKCNGEWDRFFDYTGCATSPEDLRFLSIDEIGQEPKPDYYYGTYNKECDPEATCWHCGRTFLCDCMDACCRLCGAPFDKTRCEEFKFTPER